MARLISCCDLRFGVDISLQSPGVLAAVDATVHKAVGDRFKISGFPTLKYFEKGEEKYTLPQLRSKDKIIEFMHKWVMELFLSSLYKVKVISSVHPSQPRIPHVQNGSSSKDSTRAGDISGCHHENTGSAD